MHLALVAPLVSPIHDALTPLGGAQAVVADLARGIHGMGHRVTLLAADGSSLRGAETPSLGIDSTRLAPADFSRPTARIDTAEQFVAFERVRSWLTDHAGDVDMVHAHAYDAPCFLALRGIPTPVLHTLHLPPLDQEVESAVRAAQPSATYVAVSRASAAQWRERGIEIRRSISPGLELESVPFRGEMGDFLLFAGRITPEKGPGQAIDVAAELNQPLVLAGEIYDHEYFEHSIGPRVHRDDEFGPASQALPRATYIGPRPRSQLIQLMSRARGVLMPSTWDEPFGLVGIEAQATGTPVVAYHRGGLAEVVADGETGWLVTPDDRAEFRARVAMLDQIDRQRCRARVEQLFSMDKAIHAYLNLYAELAATRVQT